MPEWSRWRRFAGYVMSAHLSYISTTTVPSSVSQAWSSVGGQIKGLMTWSINWDGSLGWTFGDNVKGLEGR